MAKRSFLSILMVSIYLVVTTVGAHANIQGKIPPYHEKFNSIYEVLSGKSKTEEKIKAIADLREISKQEKGRYYILSLQLLEKTIQSTKDPVVFVESVRFLSTRTDAEIQIEKKNNFTFFVDKKISNIDLSNMTLKHIDFSNSAFSNVNFENSSFENSFFNSVSLTKVNFANAKFTKTTFNDSKIKDARFTSSTFNVVNMGVAKISNVDFSNSSFSKSIFKGSVVENSNFTGVKFISSSLSYSKFVKDTNFTGSSFENVDLSYSNIESTKGITEQMLQGTFIIEGDKQPVMPSYLKDLNINVKDKNLNTITEQKVVS